MNQRSFLIFASVLAIGNAFPFNFPAFGDQSSAESNENSTLKYPKNSIIDAFFLNLRPNENVRKEMSDLKYPEIPFFTKATSDALSFITNVRKSVEGVVHQVQSNEDVRNLGKLVEGVLKLALGNKNGGSSDSSSGSSENDEDDFFKDVEDTSLISLPKFADDSDDDSSGSKSTTTEEASTTIQNKNDVVAVTTPDEKSNEI